MGFTVKSKGLLTLIQGSPRIGYQQYGVSMSGAMDSYSHRLGNILLGNKEDEASLEILIMGPTLLFDKPSKIAITGGDLSPRINNIPIKMWKSYIVNSGDILSFGNLKSGCRAYISFEGGIDVAYVMESKSTYTKANLGGYEGRSLKENDYINLDNLKSNTINTIDDIYIPIFKNEITLRVVKGPQDDMFSDEEYKKFISGEYFVTDECDRMGYRLDGEPIKHLKGPDIISDGIAFGAIQIPGHGKPIIMMADRQTVGGYTKIANVISTDLYKLAQAKPGDKISFEEVNIYQSHELLKLYEKEIENVKNNMKSQEVLKNRNLNITIDDVLFKTLVEEIK